MNDNLKNILFLVLLSAISALVSVYPFLKIFLDTNIYQIMGYILYAQPGIAFGLLTGFYFKSKYQIPLIRILAWTLFSAAAFLAAMFSSFALFLIGPAIYAFCGLVGGTILALAARILVSKIDQIYPISSAGAIAGLIFGLIFSKFVLPQDYDVSTLGSIGHSGFGFYLAFFVWQAIVAITLTFYIDKSRENQSKTQQMPISSLGQKNPSIQQSEISPSILGKTDRLFVYTIVTVVVLTLVILSQLLKYYRP